MAANRVKTIEVACATRITALATNTTLGTATRYDTASGTIYIPETTSRTFKSVRLVCVYRDAFTVANSITGERMGIKLGAAATSDTDRSYTAANTGDHMRQIVDLDVTDYFNVNFGAGASQTFVASLAVSTTIAANVNSICFKLVITYECDSSAHTTRVKTIRIPIQSAPSILSTVQVELGVSGTNPAPANQIPALDTFLPEASKAYRQLFLELSGNDGENTGAIAAFTPYFQIDGAAEVAMAPIEQSLSTPLVWQHCEDVTASLTTNAVHALKMRATLDQRMALAGAMLVVTYEYDHAATTSCIYEAIVPLTLSTDDRQTPNTFGYAPGPGGVAGDSTRLVADLHIQEAAPVAIVQSAAYMMLSQASGAHNYKVKAGAQAERTYEAFSVVVEQPFVHRVDHGSGWTLARGDNRLTLDFYASAGGNARSTLHGYALVNYTAGRGTDADAGNHPVNYFATSVTSADFGTTKSVAASGGGLRVPALIGAYRLTAVLAEINVRSSVRWVQPQLEQLAGEWDGDGWVVGDYGGQTAQEWITWRQWWGFTRAFNRDSLHTGKLDVQVARRHLMDNFGNSMHCGWNWWLTYHQLVFAVAGTVTVDAVPVANGKTVKIFAVDGLGVAELVTTTTTAGGTGAFSVSVPDSTRTYFASYVDGTDYGRSLDGTPGTSTFNIAIGSVLEYPAFPALTNATTADAIRDRAIAVIETQTPTYIPDTKFRAYRNEGDGEFIDWCEDNPASAFRRFQVRFGGTRTPAVSNSDHEERIVVLTTIIAYPHNARTGAKHALDRDTAIDRDYDVLEKAIGLYSRANFVAPYPDACWVEGDCVRVAGNAVDFLIITGSFSFRRVLT